MMNNQKRKKIVIVGVGYIGVVASAAFAEFGHIVVGVDNDRGKIDLINKGKMPIYEPDLDTIISRNVEAGRLTFTTSLEDAMDGADIIFICVGTPSLENGAANLQFVREVARDIGLNLRNNAVIVVKSTVPVGTNDEVKSIVNSYASSKYKFYVVSNPEFVREGFAVEDMLHPDRTVLGYDDEEALPMMLDLYSVFPRNSIHLMSFASAEMTKYVSNVFLAQKISATNSVALLCERTGADVEDVMRAVGADSRIGPRFLKAGLGWGGSCFPKDVEAFIKQMMEYGLPPGIFKGIQEINDEMHLIFVHRALVFFNGSLVGKEFAVLGSAFKSNTDDVRKSIAIEVIKKLRGEGARVRSSDPQANVNAQRILGDVGVKYYADPYEAMDGADALLLVTEWEDYKHLDLSYVKRLLKNPVIFDGRNLLNPQKVQECGFVYFAIGRQTNGLSLINEKVGDVTFAVLDSGKSKASTD
jgi:UDPglucose 6-dehydrogenase